MSIVARPPVPYPTRGPRNGDDAAAGITLRPFEDLLPQNGLLPSPSASTPRRALALDALRLLRAVAGTGRTSAPAAWSEPTFAAHVEVVRTGLGPIRSRASLAASFEREAARLESVRLAYAIRWLELGDGLARPPWPHGSITTDGHLT